MKDVKMLEIKNKKLLEQIEMLKEQNEKLLERVERAERELRQILENKIQNINFQSEDKKMIKTDIEIIQTTMLNLINDKSVEMKDIPSRYDNISEKFISVNDLLNSIDMIETNIKERHRCLTPVKKFLFVEDGSVDADNLIDSLALSNPEINVIVYRQGGCAPILKDVNENE